MSGHGLDRGCLVATVLCGLMGAAVCGNTLAGERLVIDLPLARELPVGLRVPLRGSVVGEATPGAVMMAQHDLFGPNPLVVQCDKEGRHAWLVAAVMKTSGLGRHIQLAGRVLDRLDSKSTVRFDVASQVATCRDGDQPVMVYRRTPHTADGGKHITCNYFHPLFGLDGEVLTQDFPDDHPHHHGVFWAWHQLLVGDVKAGDPWVNKEFLPVVEKVWSLDSGPVFASLATRVSWTSPKVVDGKGRPKTIVSEEGLFRVFHRVSDARHIDFEVRITPRLPSVRIGGSENVKGYSGFTVRVHPPEKMAIHDRRGHLSDDAVGSTSPWADVSGVFAGSKRVSGVSILCDRRLPQFPPKWLLRYYGMQNVAYPGRHPVLLDAKRPLILRHRLVVHHGDHKSVRAVDQQAAYEATAIP